MMNKRKKREFKTKADFWRVFNETDIKPEQFIKLLFDNAIGGNGAAADVLFVDILKFYKNDNFSKE